MMYQQFLLAVLVGVVFQWPRLVESHGRLWDPPSRSSMWRRGFNTPINYQDNELFCGGFSRQMSLGYKCGICGDPYDGVRDNEAGGKYATGTISRTYTQGQRATFQVDLTANHKGFFEFKICPTNDYSVRATQACLDLHPVSLADGTGTQFFPGTRRGVLDIEVILPADLTCEFCVVQWRYHAGNNWGRDPDGTACVGCGPQEEFYGCADIKIVPGGSSQGSQGGSSQGSQGGSSSGSQGGSSSGSQGGSSSGSQGGSSSGSQGGSSSGSQGGSSSGSQGGSSSGSQGGSSQGSQGGSSSGSQGGSSQGSQGGSSQGSQGGSSQGSQGGSSQGSQSGSSQGSQGGSSQGSQGGSSQGSQGGSSSGNQGSQQGSQGGGRDPATGGSNPGGYGQGTVPGDSMICGGVNGRRDLDQWCQLNCQVGYCPGSHCKCETGSYPHQESRPAGCRAAGVYATLPGYDVWCKNNCAIGNCPKSICVC